jgi:hypothetical protein
VPAPPISTLIVARGDSDRESNRAVLVRWRPLLGRFSRGFPTRRLNLVFVCISIGGYSIQLGLAIALLVDVQSSALQRALVLVIVGLFASAIGRAWEVTGIQRRRIREATDR